MIKNLASVIIPVKNRSSLFGKAYTSVVKQNYRPIEVIIINDGSEPSEYEKILNIIKETPPQNDFTTKIITNKTHGAPSARNLGFRESNGEFIQFFDSDDILLPPKIKIEIDFLKNNPSFDYVYSKAQYIDENENELNQYWGTPLCGNSSDFFNFHYQTMCALYRRTAVNKFGGWDENLLINQDWEFSLRYILLGSKFYFINSVHSYYRIHNNGNIGKTDKKPEIIWSKFIGHKKIFELIKSQKVNDNIVTQLFYKRFIYIYLVTASIGSKEMSHKQIEYISQNFSINIKYFNIFFCKKWIAKSFLFLYQFLLQKNKQK